MAYIRIDKTAVNCIDVNGQVYDLANYDLNIEKNDSGNYVITPTFSFKLNRKEVIIDIVSINTQRDNFLKTELKLSCKNGSSFRYGKFKYPFSFLDTSITLIDSNLLVEFSGSVTCDEEIFNIFARLSMKQEVETKQEKNEEKVVTKRNTKDWIKYIKENIDPGFIEIYDGGLYDVYDLFTFKRNSNNEIVFIPNVWFSMDEWDIHLKGKEINTKQKDFNTLNFKTNECNGFICNVLDYPDQEEDEWEVSELNPSIISIEFKDNKLLVAWYCNDDDDSNYRVNLICNIPNENNNEVFSNERKFECIDGTSSKFWNITFNDNSYTVSYGKIGTNGTTSTKVVDNVKKEVDKVINSKVKKGYIEVFNEKNKDVIKDTFKLKNVVFDDVNGVVEIEYNDTITLIPEINADVDSYEIDSDISYIRLYFQTGFDTKVSKLEDLLNKEFSYSEIIDCETPICYCVEHEDVTDCTFKIIEITEDSLKCIWNGTADIYWDDEFGSDVKFESVVNFKIKK